MTDMESLDRAVEEARVLVFRQGHYPRETCHTCEREIETLIAAVSERARAEERERIYEEQRAQSKTWPIEGANVAAGAPGIPWHTFPPRSSEEAGNGV